MAKASSKMSASTRVQRKSVRKVQAYQNLFETPNGKYVLAELMAKFHMLSPTYPANSALDQGLVLLQEGQRSVILYIMSMMNVDIEQLIERIEQNAQILNADE